MADKVRKELLGWISVQYFLNIKLYIFSLYQAMWNQDH